MRLSVLMEDFKLDPYSAEYIITFDPDTVTKHEFNDLLKQLRSINTSDPVKVNDNWFENAIDAAKFMKSLIQHRVDRYKEKYVPHQWQQGPYKNKAELVPISWLKKLMGNDLRLSSKQLLGYNPDIDDYDQGNFDDLMKSLEERGIQEPVTIVVGMRDGYAYIGEGNHRIIAAEKLGWRELPARVIVYNEARSLRGEGTYSHDVRNDLTWDIDSLGVYPEQKYFSKPSKVFKSLRGS